MITLPINTTRDLTPAELAAAQAYLDTINPPPGSITVVNTISHDAAFSGGTVTLNTPGAAPQEQFWRALNLPAVPLCATGPNVTLDFSADLTISNTISNPQGCIGVIDVTQVGVAVGVAGDVSAPPGNGTWTLSLVATALDLTKFQNGDYVVVFCSAEALANGIADFAWSNASASITYDDANCGPGGGAFRPYALPACGDPAPTYPPAAATTYAPYALPACAPTARVAEPDLAPPKAEPDVQPESKPTKSRAARRTGK